MAYSGNTGGRALNRFLVNQGLIKTLDSTQANIGQIDAGTINAGEASIVDGTFVDLSGVNLNVTNEIVGETITTTTINSTEINSALGNIADGTVTTLTTTSGYLTNADITNLNATNATLTSSDIGAATGNSLIIYGGSVGIGTEDPSSKLHVSGGVRIDNMTIEENPSKFHQIIFNGQHDDGEFDGSKNRFRIIHDTRSGSDYFSIDTINPSEVQTQLLRATTTGNIGIGTTNPTTKLDVAGTFKASGSTTLNGNLSVAGGQQVRFKGGTILDYIDISRHPNTGFGEYLYKTPFSTTGHGANAADSSHKFRVIDGNHTTMTHLQMNANKTTCINTDTVPTDVSLLIGGLSTKFVNSVFVTSNVGIGTTTPSVPLEVNDSEPFFQGQPARFLDELNDVNTSEISDNVSITATGSILTNIAFIMASDKRIKKHILDISDNQALNTFRKIQPKTYEYVDKIRKGNRRVFGFIAQEVGEVIPNSVSVITDIVPDYYNKVSFDTSGDTLILHPEEPYDIGNGTKVRVYIQDTSGIIHKVEKSVSVSESISLPSMDEYDVSDVFLYGKEVDDFHTLNKDAIWTVTTAALQEVDRMVEKLRKKDHVIRDTITLSNSTATVDLPLEETEFENPQIFLQNNEGWSQVKGSLSGNTLTITARDTNCNDNIDYMITVDLLE